MKIVIGSDKSGFTLKEAVKNYLDSQGIEYDDLGTQKFEEPVPYYIVASKVAPKIADGTYKKGVLICGTGMGMSIVANKHKNVYGACVESLYAAKMCRAINNANVLCMGGWVIAPEMGIKMVEAFLNTEFLQDLEDWRQTFLINAEKEVKKIEENIYD
ncbi:MAG: RpiB/LacA/LacB family sugar-phosphate isomerase [Clostridia bacterium]